jgi:hypothetical protein
VHEVHQQRARDGQSQQQVRSGPVRIPTYSLLLLLLRAALFLAVRAARIPRVFNSYVFRRKHFWKRLHGVYKRTGHMLQKMPNIGQKEVDLCTLYRYIPSPSSLSAHSVASR